MSQTEVRRGSRSTAREFFSVGPNAAGVDNGTDALGVSAVLVVPPETVITVADFGTVDGIAVPVGYSYAHESEDQSLLSDDVALTAVGEAYWVVTRRVLVP